MERQPTNHALGIRTQPPPGMSSIWQKPVARPAAIVGCLDGQTSPDDVDSQSQAGPLEMLAREYQPLLEHLKYHGFEEGVPCVFRSVQELVDHVYVCLSRGVAYRGQPEFSTEAKCEDRLYLFKTVYDVSAFNIKIQGLSGFVITQGDHLNLTLPQLCMYAMSSKGNSGHRKGYHCLLGDDSFTVKPLVCTKKGEGLRRRPLNIPSQVQNTSKMDGTFGDAHSLNGVADHPTKPLGRLANSKPEDEGPFKATNMHRGKSSFAVCPPQGPPKKVPFALREISAEDLNTRMGKRGKRIRSSSPDLPAQKLNRGISDANQHCKEQASIDVMPSTAQLSVVPPGMPRTDAGSDVYESEVHKALRICTNDLTHGISTAERLDTCMKAGYGAGRYALELLKKVLPIAEAQVELWKSFELPGHEDDCQTVETALAALKVIDEWQTYCFNERKALKADESTVVQRIFKHANKSSDVPPTISKWLSSSETRDLIDWINNINPVL